MKLSSPDEPPPVLERNANVLSGEPPCPGASVDLFELFLSTAASCGDHQAVQSEAVDVVPSTAVATPGEEAGAAGTGPSLTFCELVQNVRDLSIMLGKAQIEMGLSHEGLPVAVCLQRTPALPVALLAVLKVGCAYVPLEPTFPEARLRFMLEDSRSPILICSDSLLPRLEHLAVNAASVVLSLPLGGVTAMKLPPAAGHSGAESEEASGLPKGLAYLIYTSGSTGTPKGVLVKRSSVCNVIFAFNDIVLSGALPGKVHPDTLLCSVTTFCFDISALELFWPLCFGFKLFLASQATARSGPRLARLLESLQPRIFQATPATFKMLVKANWQGGDVAALCGGEGFPTSLVSPLREICCQGLWNVYGPTETTIWSTCHDLGRSAANAIESNTTGLVPIGRPLHGTQLLLAHVEGDVNDFDTDREAEQASSRIGPVGELLIGGEGVSLGYHNKPDLTVARFVAASRLLPPTETDMVIYRTGDLARFVQASGEVDFLGRMDSQVKLRGFRIELGEIEAIAEALADCVQMCCVVVKKTAFVGGIGEASLAAYVVAASSESHEVLRGKLRQQLTTKLPTYMVPTTVTFLHELPLTASGKIDRKALIALPMTDSAMLMTDHEQANSSKTVISEAVAGIKSSEGVARLAALRRAVVEILSACTGVAAGQAISKDAGLSDDYDADLAMLGIDSMSAVPFAEMLSTMLLDGEEIPLEDIYVYRTLTALCGYIQERLVGRSWWIASSSNNKPIAETAAFTRMEEARKRPTGKKQQLQQKQKAASQRQQDEDDFKSTMGAPALIMEPGLEACRHGDLAAARSLWEAGQFDAESARDKYGGSALHWAAGAGHLEVCQWLVSVRADVAFADKKSGRSAMHWCTRQGHLAVATWLVKDQGQSINVVTRDATTPFQLAAWGGHISVCQWLLEGGAQLLHRNKWECLPHHFAALAGMLEMCAWLRGQGLDLADGNNQGHNALHKAAYGGHKELCQWLQDEVGLDPACQVPDARGQTPIDLARKAGHTDLAEWLEGRRG